MPKVILWDADGVAIKRQKEYFSQRFAREHGAPLNEVADFFKTTYRQCQLGKASLVDELHKRLPKWGWQEGVSDFLEYWFTADEPDEAVLEKIRDLRSQGVVCCLATDQEVNRSLYISINLHFAQIFDLWFYSHDIGRSKEDPAFFIEVLKRLQVAPGDVQYWDDDQKNVDAAKSVGIDARLYRGIEDLANL